MHKRKVILVNLIKTPFNVNLQEKIVSGPYSLVYGKLFICSQNIHKINGLSFLNLYSMSTPILYLLWYNYSVYLTLLLVN